MTANAIIIETGRVYNFPVRRRKTKKSPLSVIRANMAFIIIAVFLAAGIWQSVQVNRLLNESRAVSGLVQELHIQQERIATGLL